MVMKKDRFTQLYQQDCTKIFFIAFYSWLLAIHQNSEADICEVIINAVTWF